MTLNELIEKAIKLKEKGYGDREVTYDGCMYDALTIEYDGEGDNIDIN